MAVVPNTEAITTGPGAASESGVGAPDAETRPAVTGPDVAPAPAPPAGRLPHIRALDGLRGLAVIGVLVYHLDLGWLPGGFLGVSLFFTMSGFLITSLVLAERSEHGAVAIGRFWGRRFRRLLPAAWAGLALAVAFAAFSGDADQLRRLPGDVWAALAYVANWRFLFAGDAYAAGYQEPSPILHYWSLAIEEQFYVLFPLVVAALIALRATRRAWFAVMGALLALSMVATLVFFDADETSRVYFSSLTRMAEILAGVLLALVLEGWWRRAHSTAAVTPADGAIAGEPRPPEPEPGRAPAAPVANGAAAPARPATLANPVNRATLEVLASALDLPLTGAAAGSRTGADDDVPDVPDAVDADATTATTATTGDVEASPAAAASATPLLRRSPVPTLADGTPRTWITIASCLAVAAAALLWIRVSTADEWVYRGGLWFVAVVSCVLVVGAITAGPVATALSWRPVVFVGTISYGIYVYHWPLFQWLSPQRTGLDGLALAVLRIAVTFAIALASYHWLERPIREGRVRLTWATGTACLAAVLVIGIVAINLGTRADARAVEIAERAAGTPVVTRPPITSPSATATTDGPDVPVSTVPVPPPERVLFIGDSLLHQAFPVINATFGEVGIETRAIGGPGTSLLFDQARWLGELETALAETDPDVVVIQSCCGYDERREPYMLLGVPLVPDTDETWAVWQATADQAIDLAEASGALVLWVLAPPARTTGYYGPIEGRIDRANAIALDLPGRHPCIGFVDWRVIAAPDGSYTDTLPGFDGEPVVVRAPDGLHFSDPGKNVLADVSLTAVIADWKDSAPSCAASRPSP